ncbi:hypothetical protein QCA50_004450 [Cerrena zonata]|uniref:Uncharacterized protein n=1 Tax=Cerrena zonata TaxID=2478898 RepID=A0AAW0GTX4_9APHY
MNRDLEARRNDGDGEEAPGAGWWSRLKQTLQAGIAAMKKLIDRILGRNHEDRDRQTTVIQPIPPMVFPPYMDVRDAADTMMLPQPQPMPIIPPPGGLHMIAPAGQYLGTPVDEGRPDVRIGGVKSTNRPLRPK